MRAPVRHRMAGKRHILRRRIESGDLGGGSEGNHGAGETSCPAADIEKRLAVCSSSKILHDLGPHRTVRDLVMGGPEVKSFSASGRQD